MEGVKWTRLACGLAVHDGPFAFETAQAVGQFVISLDASVVPSVKTVLACPRLSLVNNVKVAFSRSEEPVEASACCESQNKRESFWPFFVFSDEDWELLLLRLGSSIPQFVRVHFPGLLRRPEKPHVSGSAAASKSSALNFFASVVRSANVTGVFFVQRAST